MKDNTKELAGRLIEIGIEISKLNVEREAILNDLPVEDRDEIAFALDLRKRPRRKATVPAKKRGGGAPKKPPVDGEHVDGQS